jgi:hypothetical protein
MILSTSHGIDIMSEKLSAKIMSTDPTYIIIVYEDGYAVQNTVENRLITLHSSMASAVQTKEILDDQKNSLT